MVFEELDGFQDLVASAAEPGEFRYEDDVDRVVQAEGEGLLENGPVLVGLPAGDVLLEGLDDREMVGGCVAIEVFHLTGGVLTGFQGTGGTATGEDDGGVQKACLGVKRVQHNQNNEMHTSPGMMIIIKIASLLETISSDL